ncbi:hypothetical protein BHE74_00058269 [Ensete ventricosum]|uniref:Uncharacterized protein n=1 Tax=Ensete ventricosum TaxID=4639 RepID=A0A426XQF2_ENSVE|nr:hypothetical protein B296_00057586 [Ensete ventricosum]RWW36689.1 hypothetical protein BHE74_00058269 [Ensete ventricosum]RZR88530.1 hypothetical protein BHM03_00016132 [Ensete ventricosum]
MAVHGQTGIGPVHVVSTCLCVLQNKGNQEAVAEKTRRNGRRQHKKRAGEMVAEKRRNIQAWTDVFSLVHTEVAESMGNDDSPDLLNSVAIREGCGRRKEIVLVKRGKWFGGS